MFTPLLVLVVFLILTPFLISHLRMWTQLRLYHKTQRDFFRNRVHFVPAHPTPLAPPIRTLYNFIEADHFIAILSDPVGDVGQKAVAIEIIRTARGVITVQQQARLKRLLAALYDDPRRPASVALLEEALRQLDQATLIG
jgi:hypothetical protein